MFIYTYLLEEQTKGNTFILYLNLLYFSFFYLTFYNITSPSKQDIYFFVIIINGSLLLGKLVSNNQLHSILSWKPLKDQDYSKTANKSVCYDSDIWAYVRKNQKKI